MNFVPPPNYYRNYIEPFVDHHIENHTPIHLYTVEIRRAIFTEEIFEVYKKYEKHVHGKDRVKDDLNKFLCNSPVYNPNNPAEASVPCTPVTDEVDLAREFKDEGVYPGVGSFHMYHRIDGRLVAIGDFDITPSYYNSAYFFYDPEFSFLNMGVVSAIMEL